MNTLVTRWLKDTPDPPANVVEQLKFSAHCVHYTNLINKLTRVHGNAKKVTKTTSRPNLELLVPLLGPQFLPPTHRQLSHRNRAADVTPDSYYLKPLTVLHPFFYPELLVCPNCKTNQHTSIEGWTHSGPRDVFGLRRHETAIGVQIRCSQCKFCNATTNHEFWAGCEIWQFPRMLHL